MSCGARNEYIGRMRGRYGRAGKRYKTRLLDEVCLVCGYERKYASKLLRGKVARSYRKRGRKSYYEHPALLAALKNIWKQSGHLCGKRLGPGIELWLRDYDKHFEPLSGPLRSQLHDLSAATIDRLLKPEKARLGRRKNSGTKPGSILRSQILVRTDNEDIAQPGYLEADTVAHCGGSMSGNFIWSITYTDIITGWTAQRAVWNKGYAGVKEQTQDVEKKLPFPILGFDTDNGGEFLNYHLIRYFTGREHPVGFTRTRSYHKNDNAHVEQKNWTHVRGLLGYDRLEHPEMVKVVNELYGVWELFNNFFCPSMKLLHKERKGGKYSKRYDQAQTPYQRLVKSGILSEQEGASLKKVNEALDPYRLKKKIEKYLRKIERLKRAKLSPREPRGFPWALDTKKHRGYESRVNEVKLDPATVSFFCEATGTLVTELREEYEPLLP